MDSAEIKIARLEKSINRTGESVTFERISVNSATGAMMVEKSVTVPAWIRDSIPQDLLDNEARDVRVIVSPTLFLAENGSPPSAFGIPIRDDRVIIHGSTANVQNVAPIYYNGALVRINILARG